MKKFFLIIALLMVGMTLTACSTTGENNIRENESKVIEKRSLEGLEPVRSMDYTISFVHTFEDLEERSDLIVIGEFIDNPKTCYNKTPNIISSCPMRVTQVLAGDVQVGDVLTIYQLEGIEDDRFFSRSNLTPMQMGDEWFFCLGRDIDEDFNVDGYWCVSDNKGRYPTKNSGSNEAVCFSNYPELGVYEESDFQEEFYDQLLEKYGEF